MPRAIWKGSISFGLVHVPVALYPAEQPEELHLSLIDRRDLSPVGYRRFNKNTGEEVPTEAIARGYEYEKGEYVLLSEEDLKQANVEATQTIDIVDFVDAAQIPLLYFDKPYYLEPIQKGDKAYALLRETLKRTAKVGIAKVVLRTRQYLAALVPMAQMLVLELLRYPHELRSAAEYHLPGSDLAQLGIGDREIEMADRLVLGMAGDWEPQKYHDEYRDDLLHLVEERARAGQLREVAAPEAERGPRRAAEVIDLMAQLKRSVEQAEQARGKPAPARRSRKAAKKRA